MTAQGFEYRLSTSLAVGGVFLILVAMACWLSGGAGSDVVQSVHHVGAIGIASIGLVFLGIGLAIGQPVARDQAP